MKILVIGAASRLGKYLIPLILEGNGSKRNELILTYHHSEIDFSAMGVNPEDVVVEELDITQSSQVLYIMLKHTPPLTVHLAAYTNVAAPERDEKEKELCSRINIVGTNNIALNVAKLRGKLVFPSTDYVFNGEKPGGMYTEMDLPNPLNHYGWTKWYGEKRVLKWLSPDRVLILRMSIKRRPFDHEVAAIDMWTSAGYVGDIALEIALAIANFDRVIEILDQRKPIIHIGTARRSIYDLAVKLNKGTEKEGQVSKTTREKIEKDTGLKLAQDVSLNSSLWDREVKPQL